jgi:hypothetical protein
VGAVVEADTVAVAASMAVADFTAALPVVDSVEAALVSRVAAIGADTAAVSAEVMEAMEATDTARI